MIADLIVRVGTGELRSRSIGASRSPKPRPRTHTSKGAKLSAASSSHR